MSGIDELNVAYQRSLALAGALPDDIAELLAAAERSQK